MQSSISDDVGEKNKDEKLEEAYHLALVLRKCVRETCQYANSCPCSVPGMNKFISQDLPRALQALRSPYRFSKPPKVSLSAP